MKKLRDYSGQFLPSLTPGDFARDTLVDLIRTYSKLYMGLDGFWYLAIKEKNSNDTALACDILTWKRAARYEMARLTRQFNIQGNDVIAVMKAMQLSPWYWTTESQIEIENPNRAVLTVIHCPTLEALEKEGQGREYQICNIVEPEIFQFYTSYFNPQIKAKCLKSAPRKSKDEICCRWEFTEG